MTNPRPIACCLLCLALLLTDSFSCDMKKNHKAAEAEARAAAWRKTAMMHLRLEVWQDIRLQHFNADGNDVSMKSIAAVSTPPIAFDFWLGQGDDVKEYAQDADGRLAFVRFWNLVPHASSIDCDSWGFDTNFELATGDPGAHEGAHGKVIGWPYTQSSHLTLEIGQPIERTLSGYTDSSQDPSISYVPMARLSLIEVKPYRERTKRDPRLLVKIPTDLWRQLHAPPTSQPTTAP